MINKYKLLFLILMFMFAKANFSQELYFKEDLLLLGKSDQSFLIKKCYLSKKISENPECYNFLGIKLFMLGYKNNYFSESELDILFNKSIAYLKEASNRGSKLALKNLGWIYSNSDLKFFNLQKSSLYYSKFHKNNHVTKKKQSLISSKKDKVKTNGLSDVILAITLIEKVEIYFQARKNNKNTYLNKDEYEIAKKNFNSIIEKKNISKKKLESLKKELSKSNSIIFTFLREDLKVFNEKNIKDAQEAVMQLKGLDSN